MTDMIGTLRRRAPRFQIKNTEALRITIAKSDKSFEAIQTELVNISVGGAKFKSNQRVTVKELVAVKIDVEHPNRSISVSGEVRWIAPDGDEWWLGCAFKPTIPHEVLDELARQGVLERREYARQRIALRVSAQWQLEAEPTTVTVVDYSAGGLCLVTSSERGPGERVLLRFQLDDGNDVQVKASTRWAVSSDDGFLIGCEFDDPRDFLTLSDLLESRELLESDLCDTVTPRSVWKRLIRPALPTRTQVKAKKRIVLPPFRESASWILMGGTMLILLILVKSSQMKSSQQAALNRAATVLTSTKSKSRIDETRDRAEENEQGDAIAADANSPASETLLTIDRLLVDDKRSAFGLDGDEELETDATDVKRIAPDLQFESRATASAPETAKVMKSAGFLRIGQQLYQRGEYEQATSQFVRAATADPTSPMVRYFLGMSQYQLGQLRRAEHSIKRAVALEKERPIADWGRMMDRYHDDSRIWLEATRQEARHRNP